MKFRRALFDYEVIEKFDFGIVLSGNEVKSLRLGDASIVNAHLSYKAPHVVIHNMYIGAYKNDNTDPARTRIMLVHKREKNKLISIDKKGGHTVVPLELYWNKRGVAKLQCAIVVGKKTHDKRRSIKEREWQITKQRVLKNKLMQN